MSPNPPLISVVVAAHNEEQRITGALRSIIDQTHESWELLVVDDGSTDGTADLVRSVGDPRIHLVQTPHNIGRGAARNLAIARARGRWVAVQDADDVSGPDRLAQLVERSHAADAPIAVSGQAVCVTPGGRSWHLRRYPETDAAVKAELASGSMAVCHAACMLRTDVLRGVGGYDPRCLRAQDLNLFLRLLPLGAMVAVPDVLVRYEHPVLLDFDYWRSSARSAELARRRARYGAHWRSAPDAGADASAAARPLERLRYGAHLARRVHRYVRANGPAGA